MLFNSLGFILFFLPLTLFIWFRLKRRDDKFLFLTLASLFFYGYWDYRFVSLMLVSIFIDYWCGVKISKAKLKGQISKSKHWMLGSVISNLTILGVFKYYDFFIDSLTIIFAENTIATYRLDIILPVGISFYTFQSMSYSIDLYRNDATKVRNLLHFSAYVSMFPQLIAGPIVRYKEIASQFSNNTFSLSYSRLYEGFTFFIIGLFKKLVVADYFAQYSDLYFNEVIEPNFISSWIGAFSYAFQIFFDFSAYSEMAVGIGLMLGFNFPKNFNRPYIAKSFSDFWRRWHITLSEFLRDNLYIPLGGNKNGKINTYFNIFITMLLGGLWHGASSLFLIWGALHGFYLLIERAIKPSFEGINKYFYSILVFLLVCIAWVFFRSTNIDFAFLTIKAMFAQPLIWFELGSYKAIGLDFPLVFRFAGGLKHIFIVFAMMFSIWFIPSTYNLINKFSSKVGAIILGLIFGYLILIIQKPSPFIYFQF